jgi:CheY-like chemotaxis protein
MPDGGSLTIHTSNRKLDGSFRSSHNIKISPAEYLQIDVSDTGTGMDVETQKRAFEPFFTTKDPGQGTGLGLAAVYGTLKSHGGAINLLSQTGSGTTVQLYLPITAAIVRADPPASPATAAATRSAHVLVVEDQSAVRDALERMLLSLGCRVTGATTGEEAVEIYRKQWQSIDLVILDMVMPGISGRAAFRHMREIHPDVVALLASGYSLDEEAQAALGEGVRGFLQKPYRRAALAAELARLLPQTVASDTPSGRY